MALKLLISIINNVYVDPRYNVVLGALLSICFKGCIGEGCWPARLVTGRLEGIKKPQTDNGEGFKLRSFIEGLDYCSKSRTSGAFNSQLINPGRSLTV